MANCATKVSNSKCSRGRQVAALQDNAAKDKLHGAEHAGLQTSYGPIEGLLNPLFVQLRVVGSRSHDNRNQAKYAMNKAAIVRVVETEFQGTLDDLLRQ